MPRASDEQLLAFAAEPRCGFDWIGAWAKDAALELVAARKLIAVAQDAARWLDAFGAGSDLERLKAAVDVYEASLPKS